MFKINLWYGAAAGYRLKALSIGCILSLIGCAHRPSTTSTDLASHVELSRFMGDWYVIANLPTVIEKNAYSAVESYQMDAKGRILTTFTFRKGSFDGPVKTYHPIGTVYNRDTNAEWRMQFLWPFKAAYLIHFVDDEYSTTIVGTPDRDHVWIMARQPRISEAAYEALVQRVAALGYDTSKLNRVPQK